MHSNQNSPENVSTEVTELVEIVLTLTSSKRSPHWEKLFRPRNKKRECKQWHCHNRKPCWIKLPEPRNRHKVAGWVNCPIIYIQMKITCSVLILTIITCGETLCWLLSAIGATLFIWIFHILNMILFNFFRDLVEEVLELRGLWLQSPQDSNLEWAQHSHRHLHKVGPGLLIILYACNV